MSHARKLTMTRMRAESSAMGTMPQSGPSSPPSAGSGTQLPEFIVIGTGVVHDVTHKGFRAHDGGPSTSNLSRQDY
jgi:hypothetical protein